MSSIRKTKKAVKKSNSFCSIRLKHSNKCTCINKWNILLFHKKGITIGDEYFPYCYIPYTKINKVSQQKIQETSK